MFIPTFWFINSGNPLHVYSSLSAIREMKVLKIQVSKRLKTFWVLPLGTWNFWSNQDHY